MGGGGSDELDGNLAAGGGTGEGSGREERVMRSSPFVWIGALVIPALVMAAYAPPAAGRGGATDLAGRLLPGNVKELAVGKLLVAARTLPDPRFAETVVLLTEFNDQQAMGLIVNQRTEVTLARLLPSLAQPQAKATSVFFGGPVEAEGVLALLRSDRAQADTRHVVADVYLVRGRALVEATIAAGTGPDRLRVYVGYAGWGPGQLDREVAQRAWHVFDGDSRIVFDPDPGSVWSRQILRTEALLARAETR
jgi:putative transcriptional regulator